MPTQIPGSDDHNPLGTPIEQVSVEGFKSIGTRQTIRVKPLTLLAGANSSGKSSMLQPLLLLKQTLESSYDPGALRLDGPNVSFTSGQQLLSRSGLAGPTLTFDVSLSLGNQGSITLRFELVPNKGFLIALQETSRHGRTLKLTSQSPITDLLSFLEGDLRRSLTEAELHSLGSDLRIYRDRSLLRVLIPQDVLGRAVDARRHLPNIDLIWKSIRAVIHVPGLRGRPERTYPRAAYEEFFAGVFDPYVATAVLEWQRRGDQDRLQALNQDLQDLGLASFVEAVAPNDVEIELHVGRLPVKATNARAATSIAAKNEDRVSVADVGFGVSQTLPVVVALHAARPGQLVYIEQPELHLHPRAQVAMARVLARAANRGVRVVAETHSSLILRGVQTTVAQGELHPDRVALHWFEREGEHGSTQITSAQLDRDGSFGDWPEDFDDVILSSEAAYLDAVEFQERQAC